MDFLDWTALIIGSRMVYSGLRAFGRGSVNIPEQYNGERALLIAVSTIPSGECHRSAL
jgi:hypothetical protein